MLHLSRRRFIAALSASALLPGVASANQPTAAPVPPPEPWVQNHAPTTIWAAAEGGLALAPAPQWSYFRVAGAQVKMRLPVFDPRLGTVGWIDATKIGPSGPPPAAPPRAPTTGAGAFWAAPDRAAPLFGAATDDAPPLVLVPPFAPLRVTGPAIGHLYPVEEPFAKVTGWIDGRVLGKVGAPSVMAAHRWWGTVVAEEAYGRAEPRRQAPVVATYPADTVIGFASWVEGEEVVWDDPAWGEIAPGVYVYGRATRPLPLEEPPPPDVPSVPSGRWLGINRTAQIIVGYEDSQAQFWARTSTGRPGWETPFGNYEIIRRVPKETMDSRTLLGRDAQRADYKIENVRFTQYFTGDGNAIHENYWKDPDTFGLPSSHGCAGLAPADAERVWQFGALGMPVIVHP